MPHTLALMRHSQMNLAWAKLEEQNKTKSPSQHTGDSPSRQKLNVGTKEETIKNTAYALFPGLCSVIIVIMDTCLPTDCTAHSGLDLPELIRNPENLLQTYHRLI